MELITLIDDVEKDRKDWLNLRESYVGSSDIPILLGLSKYKSPLSLYLEKVEGIASTEDSIRLKMGRVKEPLIADLLAEESGLKIWKSGACFTRKDLPGCLATPDYWVEIDDIKCPLEIKNVSGFAKNEWENEEFPAYAIAQLNWQMGILGKTKGVICGLIADSSLRWKIFEFSKPLFELSLEKAQEFLKLCKEKTAPIAMAQDWGIAQSLFNPTKDEIELPAQAKQWLVQWEEAKEVKTRIANDLAIVEDQIKEAQANLLRLLGPAKLGKLGGYTVFAKEITRSAYTTKPSTYVKLTITNESEEQ